MPDLLSNSLFSSRPTLTLTGMERTGHRIDLDDDDDDTRRSHGRSAQGNGRLFPRSVDGRSVPARRMRELIAQLTDDIRGEPDTAESALIQRFASLTVASETIDAKLANGSTDIDHDTMIRLTRAATSVLHQLGLTGPEPDAKKRRRVRKAMDATDPEQMTVEGYLHSIGLELDRADPVAVTGDDATGLDLLDDEGPVRRRALPPVPKVDDDEQPRRRPRRGDE